MCEMFSQEKPHKLQWITHKTQQHKRERERESEREKEREREIDKRERDRQIEKERERMKDQINYTLLENTLRSSACAKLCMQ